MSRDYQVMDTSITGWQELSAAAVFVLLFVLLLAGITAHVSFSILLGITVLLVWYHTPWALACVLFLAPFVRSFSPALISPAQIADVKTSLALFVGAIVALKGFFQPAREVVWAELAPWLLLTLAWELLTTVTAADVWSSVHHLAAVAGGLAVFWVTSRQSKVWHRRILLGMLVLGTAGAIVVVLQQMSLSLPSFSGLQHYLVENRMQMYQTFIEPLEPIRYAYRPSGSMNHPNHMGLYLALLLPFAIALTSVRSLSGRWRRASALMSIALVVGLLVTDSRGAFLTAFVSTLFLLCQKDYRWLAQKVAWASLVGLSLFLLPGVHQAVLPHFQTALRVDLGLSGRLEIWNNAIRMIQENPIWGVGPGNFCRAYVARFGYFVPGAYEQWDQLWLVNTVGEHIIPSFHAHEWFLQSAAEMGIVGPILFILGIFVTVRRALSVAGGHPAGSFRRASALGVASSLLALLPYGLFDSQAVFIDTSLNLTMAALMAVGMAWP